jgi:hypothetical protein
MLKSYANWKNDQEWCQLLLTLLSVAKIYHVWHHGFIDPNKKTSSSSFMGRRKLLNDSHQSHKLPGVQKQRGLICFEGPAELHWRWGLLPVLGKSGSDPMTVSYNANGVKCCSTKTICMRFPNDNFSTCKYIGKNWWSKTEIHVFQCFGKKFGF